MDPRELLLSHFDEYFTRDTLQYFRDLNIPRTSNEPNLFTRYIELPEWGQDLGVGTPSSLLVPTSCISNLEHPVWEDVDWWRAALLMLTCVSERIHENEKGPVHSYSFKLPESLNCMWEKAWVNRIFLFLRRWVSREFGLSKSSAVDSIPRGKIYLTHDVDYVGKTLALRAKQTAFIQYNIFRAIVSGQLKYALKEIPKLVKFGFGPGDYWQFETICELEAKYGVASTWNFYGGIGGVRRSISEMLLDPSYTVCSSGLQRQIKMLLNAGHRVGLHQGFHSWKNSPPMMHEKERLEHASASVIDSCRQHWLRFSFNDTWSAQEAAGFRLDTTLGFNDRAGFRNSAALRMPAWIEREQRFSDSLESLPLILMDSHLFDYGMLDADARKDKIDRILDEVAFVGGQATIVWHQRVFHPDYGWGDDYRYLIEGMLARGLSA